MTWRHTALFSEEHRPKTYVRIYIHTVCIKKYKNENAD